MQKGGKGGLSGPGPTLGEGCVQLVPEPGLLTKPRQPAERGWDCSRTAPLLSAMQWRPPGSPSRPGPSQISAPSPYCSLAAGLHVTKQNPQIYCPAQPLCVRYRILRRCRGKVLPPSASAESRPAAAAAAHLRLRCPPQPPRPPPPRTRGPGSLCSTNSASSAAAAILACAAKCVLLDGWDPA